MCTLVKIILSWFLSISTANKHAWIGSSMIDLVNIQRRSTSSIVATRSPIGYAVVRRFKSYREPRWDSIALIRKDIKEVSEGAQHGNEPQIDINLSAHGNRIARVMAILWETRETRRRSQLFASRGWCRDREQPGDATSSTTSTTISTP